MLQTGIDLSYLREDNCWLERFRKQLSSSQDESDFLLFFHSLWSMEIKDMMGNHSNHFIANKILVPCMDKADTRLVYLAALTRHLVLRSKCLSADFELPALLDAKLVPTDSKEITHLRQFYLILTVIFPCFFDCLVKNKAKQLVIDICSFLEGTYHDTADCRQQYKLTSKNRSVKQRDALYEQALKQHHAVQAGQRLLDLSPDQLAAMFVEAVRRESFVINANIEEIEDSQMREFLYAHVEDLQRSALSSDEEVNDLLHQPLPSPTYEKQTWEIHSSLSPTDF